MQDQTFWFYKRYPIYQSRSVVARIKGDTVRSIWILSQFNMSVFRREQVHILFKNTYDTASGDIKHRIENSLYSFLTPRCDLCYGIPKYCII